MSVILLSDVPAPLTGLRARAIVHLKKLIFTHSVFQVSAALSELISEIFWALLETGCCTLRADGDRMMLWLTCLSSLHLLLLSTVREKGITFNLRRYALILNSSQFPDIRVQLRAHMTNRVLNVKICPSSGHRAAMMMHRKQVRKGFIGQWGSSPPHS